MFIQNHTILSWVQVAQASYTPQKSTASEEMLELFQYAIDKCQIFEFINCYPAHRLEYPVVYIDYFKCEMSKLFEDYIHNQKEDIYEKTYNFNCALHSYSDFLACNMKPLNDTGVGIMIPLC